MARHIKRLAAPKSWPIERKVRTWIAKPLPGAHKLSNSLALSVLIRDVLKLAKNATEARRIIRQGNVLVNNVVRKNVKFGAGLFDVISINKINKHCRILFTKRGKLAAQEIPAGEANIIPLKIAGKTILNGGKAQVNVENGFNFLTKEKYARGDTILFNTKDKKAEKRLQLAIGCIVIATAGKHTGRLASLKEIVLQGELKKKRIAVLTSGDEEWRTSADSLFVIGEKKPEFTAVMQ